MDELQAFYDAAVPPASRTRWRTSTQFALDALPDDAQTPLVAVLSLVTVSFPVEVWRQPRVPDSGASTFDEVVAPAI